jgi:A/G-specific adenine glycosylase
MLQQTRVAAVVERYGVFIERFPTLLSLALARVEDVLTVWSGLGYYKRARMLHRAAQFVLWNHAGTLPRTAEELRKLPGIGVYTAAAISSIAFHEPVAVVDGNVERVLVRLLGPSPEGAPPTHAKVREVAQQLLSQDRPGDFNQAMMELGATVCLPQGPLCAQCPVQAHCKTRGEHPVAKRRAIRSRPIAYALVCRTHGRSNKCKVLIRQRPQDAAQMPGMWELPEIEERWIEAKEPVLRLRHAITNTNHYVRIYALDELPETTQHDRQKQRWAEGMEMLEMPLTGLTRKVLMRLDILPRPKNVRIGAEIPATLDAFLI